MSHSAQLVGTSKNPIPHIPRPPLPTRQSSDEQAPIAQRHQVGPLRRCCAQAKIDTLGDPLQVIDELLLRGDARRGGRPAYPSAVMVRILILKYLYNLSDGQMEYQLLDRMSYQRFCLLTDSANDP